MFIAHVGLGVLVTGIAVVRGYEIERDVPMRPGVSHPLGDFAFTFVGTQSVDGPNFRATRARIEVTRAGERVATLAPEKRRYHAQPVPMTEAAIHRTLARDLYVSLGEPLADGGWSVRLQSKPLVGWIWGGALVMALGGFVALSDRRYRVVARVAPGVTPGATPGVAPGVSPGVPRAGPSPVRTPSD
jgi:cytochrome c-type biogenesis protein CcmF